MSIALITGASRGIGKSAALSLWLSGERVALCCKNSIDALETFAAELNAARKGSALALQADVSNPADVARLFDETEARLGPVEILVNNAGIAQQKLFTDVTEEEWDRIFAVNAKGLYCCCRAVVPHMVRRHAGSIVNVASIWGEVGASCEVPYSASKAAVIGFTKALAKELGPSGIRVNCVSPGVIATEMNAALDPETVEALREETPLGVIGRPEDAARAILWLAGEDSAFVTGQVLGVNGGFVI